MPPTVAAMGNGTTRGQVPDGALTLDLEPDHQEKHRQKAVVNPIQHREQKARAAERNAQRP